MNKSVWIIFYAIDEKVSYNGVFSSKEKAQEYIDMQREMHKEFMYIEEQELDVMGIA